MNEFFSFFRYPAQKGENGKVEIISAWPSFSINPDIWHILCFESFFLDYYRFL